MSSQNPKLSPLGETSKKIPVRHIPTKRIFDLSFTICLLALIWPFFLFIAMSIFISSRGGPIFYFHPRVGRGGKIFYCMKFRTMFPDADKRLKQILETDPSMKKEWEESQKLKNDPRITKIGRFLRKTSLDELPQFFNVLLGDLSVVGPRAMVSSEIQNFVKDKAPSILSIRPGITGLWQTSGRSDTSYSRRLILDENYVHTRSLILDIKLILKTIPVMLFSKGAY